MVVFNAVILLFCVCLIFYCFLAILQKATDSKKFKVYALRDRLNKLAMNGTVDHQSEEYRFILSQLNLTVNVFEADFSISQTVANIITPQLKSANVKLFSRVVKKAQKNDELRKILNENYGILKKVIAKDIVFSWIFMYSVSKVVALILRMFAKSNYVEPESTHKLIGQHNELISYNEKIIKPAGKRLNRMPAFA